MKKGSAVAVLFGAAAFLLFAWPALYAADETPAAAIPTGLIQVAGYRYPVALWVPEGYTAKQSYPLVVVIPAQGASPEQAVEYWESMGKRRNMIILAPFNLRPEDLPTPMDKWILGIKKDVLERYRIDKDRVYLIGKDDGAHYAAYLGTKYPADFAAVALVGGSWVGRFEELIRPQARSSAQRPFIIFLKEDQKELYDKTMTKAYQFEKKGYPVQVNKIVGEDALASIEFKKQLFDLMESKSQEWQGVVSENNKTFKERLRLAVKDFFTV